jgi:hypothetical protein
MRPGSDNSSQADLRLPQLNETRFISFEKDALLEALKLYLAATKKPLPPGMLKSFEVQKEPDIGVVIKVTEDSTGAEKVVNLAAGTIGAAMIAYCQRLRVPLPRNAEKSLLISNGVLQLRVDVRGREPKFD